MSASEIPIVLYILLSLKNHSLVGLNGSLTRVSGDTCRATCWLVLAISVRQRACTEAQVKDDGVEITKQGPLEANWNALFTETGNIQNCCGVLP